MLLCIFYLFGVQFKLKEFELFQKMKRLFFFPVPFSAQTDPTSFSPSPSSFLFFPTTRFPHAPAHLTAQPAPAFLSPSLSDAGDPPVIPELGTARDSPRVRAPPAPLKASRPLIRVLVINDNGLWINDFIWVNKYRLIHGWKRFGCERVEFWRWWA